MSLCLLTMSSYTGRLLKTLSSGPHNHLLWLCQPNAACRTASHLFNIPRDKFLGILRAMQSVDHRGFTDKARCHGDRGAPRTSLMFMTSTCLRNSNPQIRSRNTITILQQIFRSAVERKCLDDFYRERLGNPEATSVPL